MIKQERIFSEAKVLLPKQGTDYTKWSVIACDQFTSNLKYWETLSNECAHCPSALNLILPECYLQDNTEEKENQIAQNMKTYLSDGLFNEYFGYILAERSTVYGNKRTGIIMQVDLNAYDYKAGTKALIRATEGTVIERLPPRVKIREKCSLELPHIMILIDDPTDSVISAAKSAQKELLYDFELNMKGGHLKGSLIKEGGGVTSALLKLEEESCKKYGETLVMAVGDGNHSLAAAKECYERALKEGREADNLRYALVEVVNIYDSGLKFEPIHRVVFNVDGAHFVNNLKRATNGFNSKTQIFSGGKSIEIVLPEGAIAGVAFIQKFIDGYISEFGGKVDYIHGADEVKALSEKGDSVGILLKAMDKSELFEYIVKSGVLPRKTFSMGEAEEKRYYTEARFIK